MIPDLAESVRIVPSFVDSDEVASLREYAISRKEIFESTGSRIDKKFRVATVLFAGKHPEVLSDLRSLRWSLEQRAEEEFRQIEWTPHVSLAKHQPPQLTMSKGGSYFRRHTDNGIKPEAKIAFHRAITYVLYLGGDFTGGDLFLHPTLVRKHESGVMVGTPVESNDSFRVSPDPGTLVIFPSCLFHEVENVNECDQWEKGRLTVNGWLSQKPDSILKKTLQSARLGDKIAAVTKAAGIRECGGCARRRARLNGE